MRLFKILAGIFLFLSMVFVYKVPAFADKCKDPIVDEINALDQNGVERIQKAMAELIQMGADVRVQYLSSYHGQQDLKVYKDMMLVKCNSWQAADGGFKNNLVLFLVVPKKQTSAVFYGKQWLPMLRAEEARYNSDMSGKFRDGDLVGGMLIGISDVTDLVSQKPSEVGRPMVINHPADYSGLWKVLGWMLGLGVLGFLIWGVIWVFGQLEKRQAAQRNAKTEHGKCTQAVNNFDGQFAILQAKVTQANFANEWIQSINGLLDSARQSYQSATRDFAGLNRSANNPDTPWLSVGEYEEMATRYRSLAKFFASAQERLNQAEEEFRRALRGEVFPKPDRIEASAKIDEHVAPEPVVSSQRDDASGRVMDSPQTPHYHYREPDRVIVDNSTTIISPVVIEERRSERDPEYRRERDPYTPHTEHPIIADLPPEEGEGTAVDWGQSGSGGGRETAWGDSGKGGGSETSWADTKSGTNY